MADIRLDASAAGRIALLTVDTIIKMSDEAEALGGATSIAGVASLNKMQSRIQANKELILKTLREAERSDG